jgi:DNA-binding IclR family transcriptional regulator
LPTAGKGFALNKGKLKVGTHTVSAPVFGTPQKIIGCVSLVGIFNEQKSEEYGRGVFRAVPENFIAT